MMMVMAMAMMMMMMAKMTKAGGRLGLSVICRR